MSHTIHADLGPLDKIMKKPNVSFTSAPLAAMQANLRTVLDLPAVKTTADAKVSNVAETSLDKGYLKGQETRSIAAPGTALSVSLGQMVDRRVVKG